MKSAVILLSGGLDSTALLFHLKEEVKPDSILALSFDYGQKHSRELDAAKWQASAACVASHAVVNISSMKALLSHGCALTDDNIPVPKLSEIDESDRDQPSTYVPNRNMVLLSLAAAHAEANSSADVFYGAQTQDEYGYWDCTPRFIERINKVLSLNRREPVTIHAPFMAMSKAQVLQRGMELGVDYSRTWSCYRGAAAPCGTCPTCVERGNAFAELGIDDPLSTS